MVCTAGVGDLDQTLTEEVAVLVREHTANAHPSAAERLTRLLADPATPARCTALARSEFDLATVGVPRHRQVCAALAQRDHVP